MNSLKVWVEGDYGIERMFIKRGYELTKWRWLADIQCFSGGPDVSPSYYEDIKHLTTHSDTDRDARCQIIWQNGRKDQLKVGICRGSQFLNVMNGGKLWQDVDNHALRGTHPCFYDAEAAPVSVTSTHHQMMDPRGYFERWGWAKRTTFRDHGADRRKLSDFENEGPDNEIVFYPETRSLCFQPHPEYGVQSCEDLFFRCLDRALAR